MFVSTSFLVEISHITNSNPRCGKLHGHTWVVMVRLYGPYEQSQLLDLLKPVRERFNFQHLNFLIRNPTPRNFATHLARIIWDLLYSDEQANRLMVDISTADSYHSVIGSWDSYDHDDLAKFTTDQDDGWRSPQVQIIVPIGADPRQYLNQYDVRIEVEESEGMKHFEKFEKCFINATQWRLYKDSLKVPEKFKPMPKFAGEEDDKE
jgi:6-pyruvoyl-tetrahydropterin synthase